MLASITWMVGRTVLEPLPHYQLTPAWFCSTSQSTAQLAYPFWAGMARQPHVCVPSLWSLPVQSKSSKNCIFLTDYLLRLQSIWRLHHSTLFGHQRCLFSDIPLNMYQSNNIWVEVIFKNYGSLETQILFLASIFTFV